MLKRCHCVITWNNTGHWWLSLPIQATGLATETTSEVRMARMEKPSFEYTTEATESTHMETGEIQTFSGFNWLIWLIYG